MFCWHQAVACGFRFDSRFVVKINYVLNDAWRDFLCGRLLWPIFLCVNKSLLLINHCEIRRRRFYLKENIDPAFGIKEDITNGLAAHNSVFYKL